MELSRNHSYKGDNNTDEAALLDCIQRPKFYFQIILFFAMIEVGLGNVESNLPYIDISVPLLYSFTVF